MTANLGSSLQRLAELQSPSCQRGPHPDSRTEARPGLEAVLVRILKVGCGRPAIVKGLQGRSFGRWTKRGPSGCHYRRVEGSAFLWQTLKGHLADRFHICGVVLAAFAEGAHVLTAPIGCPYHQRPPITGCPQSCRPPNRAAPRRRTAYSIQPACSRTNRSLGPRTRRGFR